MNIDCREFVKWKLNLSGSGSCPMADFGIGSLENSCFATKVC